MGEFEENRLSIIYMNDRGKVGVRSLKKIAYQ